MICVWKSRENPFKTVKNGQKIGHLRSGMGSGANIMSLWMLFREIPVENSGDISTDMLWICVDMYIIHRVVDVFSTVSTAQADSKSAENTLILLKFGKIHKYDLFKMCKMYFFHTIFHNLWKTRSCTAEMLWINAWKSGG